MAVGGRGQAPPPTGLLITGNSSWWGDKQFADRRRQLLEDSVLPFGAAPPTHLKRLLGCPALAHHHPHGDTDQVGILQFAARRLRAVIEQHTPSFPAQQFRGPLAGFLGLLRSEEHTSEL